MVTFAQLYQCVASQMIHDPNIRIDFSCRKLAMAREMPLKTTITMDPKGVSVFSLPGHRVVPIRFMLAELCWILAGKGDLESIASYNKAMVHFSDDGETVTGSYGLRLKWQLPVVIERLMEDIYTRQACAAIFIEDDCLKQRRPNMPCNVFLQYLCRPPLLDLHVTSRSSDFVTGFSIDTFHWQALLIMMANELIDVHETILPNVLHYTIASLHVYAQDMAMMDGWITPNVSVPTFEHFIPMRGKLHSVMHNAKRYFTKDLSIAALMDILHIDESNLSKLCKLDEMFKTYRNHVVR